MKILITGATGFLGSRIVEHFSTLGEVNHIVATGRKFSHPNKIVSPKVTYILGDLMNEKFVSSLFQGGIDAVVNCASLSSPWGKYEWFYQANVITQKNMIAASEAAGVQRFVYISTPSIYFEFKDKLGIKESDPLPATMINHYAQTKLEAESLIQNSHLEYVILRPRALTGRGDTVIMPRMIRSYKEGKLTIMGSGHNVVDLTSVANVVEAVRLSVWANPKQCRTDYNISNGIPVPLWKNINLVLSLIGYQAITKKIPYSVLYAVATLMEWQSRLSGSQKEPTLTRYTVGVLAKSFSLDISKAREKLGYHPIQTIEEAIEEFAFWYKKNAV